MKSYYYKLISLLLLLNQSQLSFCTFPQIFDKFWLYSCEFSEDINKYFLQGERGKRSIVTEDEPNLEDPEELFNYLYPLAKLSSEDVARDAQRSATQPNPVYAWILDLGHLWVAECRSRAGQRDPRNTNGTVYEEKDMDDFGIFLILQLLTKNSLLILLFLCM